jgi:hypothetical protein
LTVKAKKLHPQKRPPAIRVRGRRPLPRPPRPSDRASRLRDEIEKIVIRSSPILGAIAAVAEGVIQCRLQDLEGSAEAGHGLERAALKIAMKDLFAIKTQARLP